MEQPVTDIYRLHSELTRPLALERHVQDTVRVAHRALREEGIDAAVVVLAAAVPRYERLSGGRRG